MNPLLFKSHTRQRMAVWGSYALALGTAPYFFSSSAGLTTLTQIGIAIIACLSYNLLLGGGMLSFGHAIYTGFGSFLAIYALVGVNQGALAWLPVSLTPLVGGLCAALLAVALGWISTKRDGTAFAMITLGLGELVWAISLMFPEVFGGEAGISSNRVTGANWLGITLGPPIELYYLIAVYTLICTACLFALTKTPLGSVIQAVRDNPERAEFIGYNAQLVRYLTLIISAFFAGIAGGLSALNLEIVTSEVFSPARSASYLLFTLLGGASVFWGPVLGGVLLVVTLTLLAQLTKAWILYVGLLFLLLVMHSHGGLAQLIVLNRRLARLGLLQKLWPSYLALGAALATALAGATSLIEMIYHLQLNAAMDANLHFLGLRLDTQSLDVWVGAAFALALGLGLFELVRRRLKADLDSSRVAQSANGQDKAAL